MAIKISGTTVIDDSRNFSNVGIMTAGSGSSAISVNSSSNFSVGVGVTLTGSNGDISIADEFALERLDASLGCVLNPAGVVEEAEDVVAQLALAVLDGALLRLGECVVDLGLHGASVFVQGDELDVLRGVFDADAEGAGGALEAVEVGAPVVECPLQELLLLGAEGAAGEHLGDALVEPLDHAAHLLGEEAALAGRQRDGDGLVGVDEVVEVDPVVGRRLELGEAAGDAGDHGGAAGAGGAGDEDVEAGVVDLEAELERCQGPLLPDDIGAVLDVARGPEGQRGGGEAEPRVGRIEGFDGHAGHRGERCSPFSPRGGQRATQARFMRLCAPFYFDLE